MEGNYLLPMPPPTTALITGATEGIGRATAFALGRAGYRVGVCARTESKVRQLLEELRGEGIEAAGAPADVGQPGPGRPHGRDHVTGPSARSTSWSTTPASSSPSRSRS